MESNFNEAVLEGLVMSDGSLYLPKDRSVNYKYTQQCTHREFLSWVQKLLPTASGVYGPTKRYNTGRDTSYEIYTLMSRVSSIYTELHERWYPDGKKAVPRDVVVNSYSLLAVYLSNGCVIQGSDRDSIGGLQLSFDYAGKSVNYVAEVLESKYKLGVRITESKPNQFRLVVKARSALRFLDIIGPCPIAAYKYKWDIKHRIPDEARSLRAEKWQTATVRA